MPRRRKPNPGMCRCLCGCDQMFYSEDKPTSRISPKCAKKHAARTEPRIKPVRLIGADGHRLDFQD